MNTTKKTFTIETSEEQLNTLNTLLETRNVTIDQLVQKCFEKGLYDVNYRTKRNREEYQKNKDRDARIAELERMLGTK